MRHYSAIIADDEPNLCEHLASLLQKLWPELQLIGAAHSGPEALSLIRKNEPDIAFLDIKMPVINGVNVAMRAQGLCHIVFISAYDEFAIQAFEQDAIDYVLKPVTEKRLTKTIQKLKDDLSLREQKPPNWNQLLEKLSTNIQTREQSGHLQWLRVGKDDKILLVPADDVVFFRSEDKYTTVITRENEYLIRKPIKELAAELDSNQFWQINRGIIVNVSCIVSTQREQDGRYTLYLKESNKLLRSSRKYSYLFKQM